MSTAKPPSCALEQILAILWCWSAILWFSLPVQGLNLPAESQLKLGETHCCVLRELHVVDSTEASRVPFYHQSWRPVSYQGLRSANPKKRRSGCPQEQPTMRKVPLLCSIAQKPLAVLLRSHGEHSLECPEGGKGTFHNREDHRPGKRNWQFKADPWQFRLIRNMVYWLCC